MPTANEIRQQFIDFFVKKHGHTFVPSSPVVPRDDPTLLFTNAGMNQFKPYFLGTEKPPYLRVANTQKCIRAGGKHNDLDDVGKDTYHHTFFEMLGNWSFGDYFKKEAIHWAWELLTEVWKLDKSRLHVTVFEGGDNVPRDEEAADWWKSVGVDPSHIHYFGKKDNFWEMGETGPCGPCTEIHYDKTPDKRGRELVNKGSPDVIEIWNLVFIQYNRNPDKSLTPLPAKHVDTGMGFERITSVLQGKNSNYDTDIFTPIFDAIQKVTGAPPYTGKLDDLKDTAYRVIADHIRTLTFAITDGAAPSNEGRGYVLRSIVRRAVRFGWQQLRMKEPFLHRLVESVVGTFDAIFPELRRDPACVERVIHSEEIGFLQTLERGMEKFSHATASTIKGTMEQFSDAALDAIIFSLQKSKAFKEDVPAVGFYFPDPSTVLGASLTVFHKGRSYPISLPGTREEFRKFIAKEFPDKPTISGKMAFDLHTEQGVFIDITEQMANELGLAVDRSEYERLFREFQEKSGVGRKRVVISAVQGELPPTDDSLKYQGLTAEAQILGWVDDNTVISGGLLLPGKTVGLILDQTCFYAEAGGQVGDSGTITGGTGQFIVETTQKLGETVLHVGHLPEGLLEVGQDVKLQVATDIRLDTMRNHTATHLLNFALRKVLGEHVEQKGSLVDAEKTRFDFAHDKPLSPEQIAEIEQIVNEQINRDRPVTPVTMPLAQAKQIPGVRAVFGEKYPDPVRVLLIGPAKPEDATIDDPIEFCGGTHLSRTSQAGLFKIVSQEAVGKGVRRVTAVTGRKAVETVQKLSNVVGDLAGKLDCSPDELPARVEAMQEELKKLQTQLKKNVAGDLNAAVDKLFNEATVIKGPFAIQGSTGAGITLGEGATLNVEKGASIEVENVRIIIGELPGGTMEQVRQQTDRLISKAGTCVIVLGWQEEGKAAFRAVVTSELTKKVHAGNLIKEVVGVVGGRGGGKPDKAEAGGPQVQNLADALALAKQRVMDLLPK